MCAHLPPRAALLTFVFILIIYTIAEFSTTRTTLKNCAKLADFGISESTVGPRSLSVPGVADAEQQVISTATDQHAKHGSAGSAQNETRHGPTVGKVTMLYGAWAEEKTNQLVLRGHEQHARKHGHSFHVLDRRIMHGMWSKLSFLLHLVLEELAKPEEDRIKWLFWFDLDIVVTNPNIPLELFLPPDDKFSHINVLVTNDHNGLNTGAFYLRVGEWAVQYLVDIIALHSYKPDLKLQYSDQSAQEIVTKQDHFANNTMYVPQRWFNAYRGPRDDREQLIKGQDVPENTIQPGDLQLHFAGKKVKHLIPTYLELAANNSLGWEMPVSQTSLGREVAVFWKLAAERASWSDPL